MLCRKCKIDKLEDQFSKGQTACKSCGRLYYQENRERIKARTNAHYYANREKAMAQQIDWAHRNRTKVRGYKAKWDAANPLAINQKTARYRARKRKVTIGPVSYTKILERDGYWCYLCQTDINSEAKWPSHDSLSYDHVVPVSRGGSHTEDNIKITHLGCNWEKGDKSWYDSENT